MEVTVNMPSCIGRPKIARFGIILAASIGLSSEIAAIGQAERGLEGLHPISQHAEKRWINEAIIARITGGTGYRPGDRVCVGLREKQHDHSVIKILAGMRQRLVRKGHEVEQFQLSHRPERG